jgi:hypothetical protein
LISGARLLHHMPSLLKAIFRMWDLPPAKDWSMLNHTYILL